MSPDNAAAGPGRLCPPWDEMTFQGLAEKAAAEGPARVFLRDCPAREQWNGVDARTLTRDTFLRGARLLAAQLLSLGLRPGERVLILLPNTAELALSVFACRLAGAVPAVAPIDETPDVLRTYAERINAAVVLTCGHVGEMALGEKARLVAARALCVRGIAGFGFDLVEGIVSLEGWSEEDVDPLPERSPRQNEEALITFSRDAQGAYAAVRTEAQVMAEALALHSVLRLDGRRGLISLMQPGASASIAASLVLPLHAGASVRLVGPYAREVVSAVVAAEPTAFLLAPDHYLSSLDPAGFPPGLFANCAGFLALARLETPRTTLLRPGPFKGALAFDYAERGLMTRLAWPIDGRIDLPHRYDHPMESVLPEEVPMLVWSEEGLSGFGAPRIIRKANAAERAA